MTEIIEAKIRKVGTSLGVLIPKKMLAEGNFKEGQTVSISLFKKNMKLINESFGLARGVKIPFERDRIDRIERYEQSKVKSNVAR